MAAFLIFWAYIWSNVNEWKGIVSSEHDAIYLLFTGTAGGCFSLRICSTNSQVTVSSSERTPLEVSVNLAISLNTFPVLLNLLNCCA